MIWLSIILLLLLGLALTILGQRGRRIDKHPLCRRCGYDLTGLPKGSQRCSECGAELNRTRAIVVGHRQRRAWPLGVGSVMLGLVALIFGFLVVGKINHTNWLRYATVNYLLRQASSVNVNSRVPALAELSARFSDGRLTGAEWDKTAEEGLAYQGDVSKPWGVGWGNLLEMARAKNRLSDKQWKRYAKQAVRGVFYKLQLRPRVRLGDLLPYRIMVQSGRVGQNSPLSVDVHDVRVRWGNEPEPHTEFLWPKQLDDQCTISVSYRWEANYFPHRLSVGPHVVHLTGDIWIGPSKGFDDVTAIAKVPLDMVGKTTLNPSDKPSVVLVSNPSLDAAVRRSLYVRLPVVKSRGGVRQVIVGVNNNPVALSFAVILRTADGHRYLAGHVTFGAHTGNTSEGLPFMPAWMIRKHVDVILKSDPAGAVQSVDITQVWEGEIIFKDVH